MNGHEVWYIVPSGVKVVDLKYRETGYDTEFSGKPSLSGGLVTIYIFFYFSVALVADRGKSPQLRGFPRQPARQRECNKVATGRDFQKGSSICSVTSTNPSGIFSAPLLVSVAGASRSQPFCLPYSGNIRGLEK